MKQWNPIAFLVACFAFFNSGGGAARAQSFAPNGRLQAVRSEIRDTTVIRVIRGSVWRDTMRIRESLRLGGLDGPQEAVFSAISGAAIGKNWEIAVFDESDHRLQVFDREGRLLRVLGREGAGPGEYRSNTGLVFTSDNGVMQLDPGNSRINRYSGDGASAGSVPVQRVVRGARGLALDSRDNIYVRSWFPAGAEPIIGFMVYTPDGSKRDSLLPPRAVGQVVPRAWYEPHGIWTLGRGRQWLGGMSNQYSVTIGSANGVPLRIERSSDPIPFTKDEYRDAVARAREQAKRDSRPVPSVPRMKPFLLDLIVDSEERIWVRVSGQARRPPLGSKSGLLSSFSWVVDTIFDVYKADGTYMGVVVLPPDAWFVDASHDAIWVIERGPLGEQYVVQYQMILVHH